MRQIAVILSLFLLLTACGIDDTLTLETTLLTGVAWGERVEVNSPNIANPATVRYRIGNGAWQTRPVVSQQAGRVVFDLPEVPSLPALPFATTTPYTLSWGQYSSPLSNQQLNQYRNRGVVKVQITSGKKKVNVDYLPYGAVEAGEVTLLAESNQSCAAFLASLPAAFSVVDSATDGNLCYATLGFSQRGTVQAIALLSSLELPNMLIDKNTVSGFDPGGARSFDPSCDQIAQWLDPVGSSGYAFLLPSAVLSSSNAAAAHSAGITGAGVNITVIGGGFDSDDEFACVNQQGVTIFDGHDTHVAALIQTLAPGATIAAKIVCDSNGNCPTSEIVKALLEVRQEAQQSPGPDVVNISLGGPLPNSVLERTLQRIEPAVTVISSSGNGPYAPAHYPASYSSGGLNPGPLSNVISVAASGFAGSWQIAGFNSRTAELFAPGVNVCVSTATGFRCDPTAPTAPDNLGLTGSSWASPIATGMAALYHQHSSQSLSPAAMRTCLTSAAQQSPNLNRMIWFDASICP